MMIKAIIHAMRTSHRFVAYGFLIAVTVFPAGLLSSSSMAVQRWETYSDQRFGFQIEYPNGWYMAPREDSESKFGETLSFSNLPFPSGDEEEPNTNRGVVITVGFYLAEILPGQPINQWVAAYEQKARIEDHNQIIITENFSALIARRNGWRLGGTAELGAFHVTMVPVEKIVWFIWSNAEGPDLGIYNHMVTSFDIGNRPPKSLKDIYGEDFKPMPIMTSKQSTSARVAMRENPSPAAGGHLAALALQDPSGYRLPFTGRYTITQGPGCGATHVGRSSEAIDYGLPSGRAVKATYGGVTSFVGWNNQGFGNLVNIDHGPSPIKRSYYAHLQSFGVSTVGISVSKGQVIGYSGATGGNWGPHLHFEVRRVDTNYSIWIRTLPTTVWYSGSANSPCIGTGDEYDGYATGP